MKNVTNQKDKNEFVNKTFTVYGYQAIESYLSELVKIYFQTEKYPIKMGIVLDLPLFHWDQEIKSKEELEGRIKFGMKILGLSKVKYNNVELSFNGNP